MERKPQYQVDVMSAGQKFVYWLLVLIWFGTLLWFWQWWLSSDHVVTILGLLITSYVAAYQTLIPIWFFWFAGHAKKPNLNLPLPAGRVAFMTTKVPSEPNEMLERTLSAMLAQDYPTPFDVWLAAEESINDNPTMYAWCKAHGVSVTCRKGIPEFNRRSYPGQTRTKEGNTLSWFAMLGYDKYDFVVQMDSDHAPGRKDYLRYMIAPFINPKVGIVAAPSMNDANSSESWAVKGRVNAETTFHGLMQAGYGAYGASMAIGSHYAVRTKALKVAGGPGPTRAEDAGTTLLVAAAGYDSVFSINADAHGDGPGSFSAIATQEVDWSSSLMRLLLEWTPKVWHKLPTRKKVIFAFSQGWYPSYASHMVIGIFLPVIALITGLPWMNMNYVDFIWRWWALIAACLLPIWYIKSQGWFRPAYAPVMSWELLLFQAIRWPWVVIGCIQGTLATLFKTSYTFHLTPKGKDKARPLGLGSILPYLMIIMMSGLAIITIGSAGRAEGYRWLSLLDITIYTVVLSVIVFRHYKEVGDLRSRLSGVPGILGTILSVCIIIMATASAIPKLSSVFAAPAYQNSTFIYEGLRTQLGPTPYPTVEVNPIVKDIPTIIPFFPTPVPPPPLPVVSLTTDKILTGMYNPGQNFANTHFDLAMYFTDWNNPDGVDTAITDAQNKNEFPVITVQPYHKDGLAQFGVLSDIVAGKYDDRITAVAQVLAKHAPQTIIVRWGHEMEFCKYYDWSICAPAQYVAAYRYVVDKTRALGVKNVLWMWSPVGGNPNTDQFYPGPSYVDYIGITGLVAESWDHVYGVTPAPQSFAHLLDQKYGIASEFHKPLIIAEMGISYNDPAIERTQWLTDAFAVMKDKQRFPLIAGWIYYEDLTIPNAHTNLLPDFRVSSGELLNAITLAGGF